MATSLKKFYWCSCTWLALIQDEIVVAGGVAESRGSLCRAVIKVAAQGGAEIYTSGLSLVEVCKPKVNGDVAGEDLVKDFFENDYIVIVAVDRQVGEIGRTLMRSGYPGLKPMDASHIAAAIVSRVDELHTFDDAVLNLDNKIDRLDGKKLRICKPALGGVPLPLLETASGEET